MNAEIMMLEEDIEDGTMRAAVHFHPKREIGPGVFQAVKRIGIFKRGDFAAARQAIDTFGGIGSVQLQMDWYGGRDAFTPAEQEAFRAAFDGMETIIRAG